MKKKLLSLALALALCLSLAVPALAGPSTYENGTVRVTNVLSHQRGGAGIFFTCEAPARFSPGTELNQEVSGASAYRIPDGVQVATDNYDYTRYVMDNLVAPVTTEDGNGVILTEPGWYAVDVYAVPADIYAGIGEAFFLVHVQAPADDGADAGFTDVKPGDWFADAVKWAVGKGITAGTSKTTFSPGQDCTVAQILTFLWRANGSPKPAGGNPFSDVKDGDWFADAAAWAHEKGMVTGAAFGGSTLCTRSMAVTYMWQAAGSPAAKAADFADVPADAGCAAAVAWAVEQGVTAGTSETTFSPDSVCTRGQIATFLYRGLAK